MVSSTRVLLAPPTEAARGACEAAQKVHCSDAEARAAAVAVILFLTEPGEARKEPAKAAFRF